MSNSIHCHGRPLPPTLNDLDRARVSRLRLVVGWDRVPWGVGELRKKGAFCRVERRALARWEARVLPRWEARVLPRWEARVLPRWWGRVLPRWGARRRARFAALKYSLRQYRMRNLNTWCKGDWGAAFLCFFCFFCFLLSDIFNRSVESKRQVCKWKITVA